LHYDPSGEDGNPPPKEDFVLDIYYVIVLRIVHIFSGVFWAGGTFFLVGAITPAVRFAGPDGAKFMQHVARQGRMSRIQATAAGLTVLAGLLLYWRTSGHLNGAWITSGPGLALTIGGAAGIIAAAYASIAVGGTSSRMGRVAQAVHDSGGPPTPEQMAQLQQLGARMGTAGMITAALLVIALLGMSISQYLIGF
jgi:hypothetical protein